MALIRAVLCWIEAKQSNRRIRRGFCPVVLERKLHTWPLRTSSRCAVYVTAFRMTFSRKTLRTLRVSSWIKPWIRFTLPRRASRRIAGLVNPMMLSRRTFLWRLVPPFPNPFPAFPLPERLSRMYCILYFIYFNFIVCFLSRADKDRM